MKRDEIQYRFATYRQDIRLEALVIANRVHHYHSKEHIRDEIWDDILELCNRLLAEYPKDVWRKGRK
jgi:hypothetical protein